MSSEDKATRRTEMDLLTIKLRTSLRNEPADFDGRERLWMRREDLRAANLAAEAAVA
jgi:hypothetical protein